MAAASVGISRSCVSSGISSDRRPHISHQNHHSPTVTFVPAIHSKHIRTCTAPQFRWQAQCTLTATAQAKTTFRSSLLGVSFEDTKTFLNDGWGGQWKGLIGKGRKVRCLVMSVEAQAPDSSKVLVIGGGGREHAICWALKRSPSCSQVFCAPGNAGIAAAQDADCLPELKISDGAAVVRFCRDEGVGLVVVGPEAPLVAGLVDDLTSEGIPAFGPTSAAAALEGSKAFMKNLCDKYNIPTAAYRTFTDPNAAKDYIRSLGAPIVVKADGLAAGKGVVVAKTMQEASEAVDDMLLAGKFGSAGGQIVVEEFLAGEEASFFALVDGETALPLMSAQDHKPVGDGDMGPNTGGMGAYSPAPVVTPRMQDDVMRTIIEPTVRGMAAEGCKFVGVLYAGLMIDPKTGVPKLLEYNVRFGDPECQALMMRLKSDLAQVLLKASQGKLSSVQQLEWRDEAALCVVLATNGYPGSFKKGSEIRGLDEAVEGLADTKVFHAGTALNEKGQIVSAGGRVLGVTALGKDVREAQAKAYKAVDRIDWPEGFCRRDIGWRAIERTQE